jgi:rod shape determining protein RodA
MKVDRRLLLNFDWTLFGMVLIICAIGLMNIYSTGYSLADIRHTSLYIKQMQSLAIGVLAMFIAFSVDYRFIARHAYVIYGISIALLVAVFILGTAVKGSQRWINLGGFSFQPSEMMKLTLILVLARYLDEHRLPRPYRLRELAVPFLIVFLPFFIILKQPDLGTALMLLIIFISMIFFVGVRLKSVLLAAAGFLTLLPAAWFFLKDYQKQRLLTFLNPDQDPLGTGYHILQSMIAIGSGGLLGKGFLKGTQTQLKFLPEQQTDFIFSVFAEEWGFLGGLVLVLLFLALILWAVKIARHARDFTGMMIAFGIAMFLFWEVFINIGMVLGLLPVVGIPLPFFSYGGSSLVVMMTAVGLLLNISVRRYILQP